MLISSSSTLRIGTNAHELFLELIRVALGRRDELSRVRNAQEWEEVKELAARHGLLGFLQDGLERLPTEQKPPKMVMLRWIGEVLNGYEFRYAQYRKAIAELAGFYNKHGLKMMVLKGYACSLDWPRPEHRPCGDIDIWLFGRQKEADALFDNLSVDEESLESVDKVKIDRSHHHHTVFYWKDFMVENHYDFINVHYGHRNREIEVLLKWKGADDSHFVDVNGERVWLPSADLHALFLLRHAILHFSSGEITLRQVLDWAFFVEKHGKDVDWGWLDEVCREYGMTEFLGILLAICEEDLGFDFDLGVFTPDSSPRGEGYLKERVLKDILEPEFSGETPVALLPRVAFKYRRWRANGWKHELCYGDSRVKSLLVGVWNHLLRPSSI